MRNGGVNFVIEQISRWVSFDQRNGVRSVKKELFDKSSNELMKHLDIVELVQELR